LGLVRGRKMNWLKAFAEGKKGLNGMGQRVQTEAV